jgi:hypothetical protein
MCFFIIKRHIKIPSIPTEGDSSGNRKDASHGTSGLYSTVAINVGDGGRSGLVFEEFDIE